MKENENNLQENIENKGNHFDEQYEEIEDSNITEEEIKKEESQNLDEKVKIKPLSNIKNKAVIIAVSIFVCIASLSLIKNLNKDSSENIIKEVSKPKVENKNSVNVELEKTSYKDAAKKRQEEIEEKINEIKENSNRNNNDNYKDYNSLSQEEKENLSEYELNQYKKMKIQEMVGENLKLEQYYSNKVEAEFESRNSEIELISINNSTNTNNNDELLSKYSKEKSNLLDMMNKYDEEYNKLSGMMGGSINSTGQGIENSSKTNSNMISAINNIEEYNSSYLKTPISKYELKAGGVIPGIMFTGINSELPGQMIGMVRENIYDTVTGHYLLIPKGTKILGSYSSQVDTGQKRVFVVWQRLILPNGKSILLDKFPGVDMTGYAGMTGKVDNHTLEMLKSVVLSTVIGGTSFLMQGNEKDKENNSIEKALKMSAGTQAIEVGSNMVKQASGLKPTITIKPGTKFNIIVNSDLLLEKYKK